MELVWDRRSQMMPKANWLKLSDYCRFHAVASAAVKEEKKKNVTLNKSSGKFVWLCFENKKILKELKEHDIVRWIQCLRTLRWNTIVQPARQISLTACAKIIINLSLLTERKNFSLGWSLSHMLAIFSPTEEPDKTVSRKRCIRLDLFHLFLKSVHPTWSQEVKNWDTCLV